MANPRVLDKRRRSIRNIRKITRTMELIATARFKKAMDRASAATAYTNRMTKLVQDLLASGLEVSHPLLEKRESVQERHAARAHGQSRSVRRLQRQPAAGRLPPLARAASKRSPIAGWKSSGKRGICGVQVPRHHARRRPTRTSKTSRRSTKSTSSPAATSTNTSPAGSIGSTSSTRSSRASPGNTSSIETLLPLSAIGGDARDALQSPIGTARPKRRPPRDLRIPAVAGKHFGRSRADQLQDQTVQVLPGLGRQRADRPHGRHEERHRKRRRSDPPPEHAIQPRPTKPHHVRTDGRHRRRRSA